MDTQPLAVVRAQLSRYVEEVASTHERVVITRNGVPAAVLMSADDLESLQETVAVLSDPDAVAALAESRRPGSERYSLDDVAKLVAQRRDSTT